LFFTFPAAAKKPALHDNVKYDTALQLAPAKAIVSLLQLELRNLPNDPECRLMETLHRGQKYIELPQHPSDISRTLRKQDLVPQINNLGRTSRR